MSLRCILFGCALLVGACGPSGVEPPPTPSSNPASHQAPIVNGALEAGFDSVGALTLSGGTYRGAFCTGTLINADWVLTAAHCLVEQDGLVLRPEVVSFMTGTDARPSGGGPTAGTLHATAAFHIHPNYDTIYDQSDIALIKLASPVAGITPVPYNASMVLAAGQVPQYVGFGVTEGIDQTGSGLKRSTQVAITEVGQEIYASDYMGSSVCFGDSGGPALLDVMGETRVVGVNSQVGGCNPANDPSCPADPCERGMYITRVDVFAPWIASVVGAAPPDCRQDAAVCACAAACSDADGSCDDSACQTDDCGEVYACLRDCQTQAAGDPNCGLRCYARGTDSGRQLLDEMLDCFEASCADVPDDQFSDCASQNCQAQVDACLPPGTGPLTCDQMTSCMGECAEGDVPCQSACYEQGTANAQSVYDALSACVNAQCSGASDLSTCIVQSCADELGACDPADNCSLAGGDCPQGTACIRRAIGGDDCVPSDGVLLGEDCVDSGESLPCADGLFCWEGKCEPVCVLELQCDSPDVCTKPLFSDAPDVGLCLPPDSDPPTQTPDAGAGGAPTPVDAGAVSRPDAGAGSPGEGHPGMAGFEPSAAPEQPGADAEEPQGSDAPGEEPAAATSSKGGCAIGAPTGRDLQRGTAVWVLGLALAVARRRRRRRKPVHGR